MVWVRCFRRRLGGIDYFVIGDVDVDSPDLGSCSGDVDIWYNLLRWSSPWDSYLCKCLVPLGRCLGLVIMEEIVYNDPY